MTTADLLPPQRPLQETDIQLSPTEQAAFKEIAEKTFVPALEELKTPEDKQPTGWAGAAPIAEVMNEKGPRGLIERAKEAAKGAGRFAFAHAVTGVDALGNKLRKADADPEKSSMLRKYARVGAVAVGALIPLVTSGVAAAKGIDASPMSEAFQPGMTGAGGHGHAAANHIEMVSDNRPDIVPDTTGNTPKFLTNNANARDIEPYIASDLSEPTYKMPKYKGPDDSFEAHANEELRLAFADNDISPNKVTPGQVNELVEAFKKENGITNDRMMQVQEYQMGEYNKTLQKITKEALHEKVHASVGIPIKHEPISASVQNMGPKQPTVPEGIAEHETKSSALLTDTPKNPAPDVKQPEKPLVDITKLPEKLELPDKIQPGEGTLDILERNTDLSYAEQLYIRDILNSDEMRTELIKLFPNQFYEFEYPKDHADQSLAGTKELRLQYNDGHFLNAEQKEQLNRMYRHIIDERMGKKPGSNKAS